MIGLLPSTNSVSSFGVRVVLLESLSNCFPCQKLLNLHVLNMSVSKSLNFDMNLRVLYINVVKEKQQTETFDRLGS